MASSNEPVPSTSREVSQMPISSNVKDFTCSLELPKTSETRIEYRVYHGMFKWKIGNFSAFPRKEDKSCMSPEFVLKETSWYLEFRLRARSSGVDIIALKLIRSREDLGTPIVRVSYRLGLENAGNKVWFRAEENKVFTHGSSDGFRTSIFGHLEDFMAEGIENNDDTLSVLCEVYVLYLVNAQSYESESDVDPDLSKDLLNLFKSKYLHDILIEIHRRNHVAAHKCVLYARSKTLARMIEDGNAFLQFKCSRSNLDCVVFYMYTGRLNILAKKRLFGIGLYEFARELSLTELSDIVKPQNIEMQSQIVVKHCKIIQPIGKSQLLDISEGNEEIIANYDEATGIGYNMRLKKSENSPGNLECDIGLSGDLTALQLCFTLFLVKENGDSFETIPAELSPNSEPEFKNSAFFHSLRFADVLPCSLDDYLCIVFRCTRCSLKHLPLVTMSEIGCREEIQKPFHDPSAWLNDLSSDLKQLYVTGRMKDLTLESDGVNFPVHRPILVARSKVFKARIPETSYFGYKNVTRKYGEFQPDTLNLMFYFMYTGTIPDKLTADDILELYAAAEHHEIKSLVSVCERAMERYLDDVFVYDIQTVAERFKNDLLNTVCDSFLDFRSDSSDESMEDS